MNSETGVMSLRGDVLIDKARTEFGFDPDFRMS